MHGVITDQEIQSTNIMHDVRTASVDGKTAAEFLLVITG